MRHDVEKDVRIAKRSLEALMKAGADKAQTNLSISEKHEMNIEAGEINLLRTTFNTSLHLGVIKDSRNGHRHKQLGRGIYRRLCRMSWT